MNEVANESMDQATNEWTVDERCYCDNSGTVEQTNDDS